MYMRMEEKKQDSIRWYQQETHFKHKDTNRLGEWRQGEC